MIKFIFCPIPKGDLALLTEGGKGDTATLKASISLTLLAVYGNINASVMITS